MCKISSLEPTKLTHQLYRIQKYNVNLSAVQMFILLLAKINPTLNLQTINGIVQNNYVSVLLILLSQFVEKT
jgi:hypothetical protein